ncbi:MAG: substrate-binding domain-containing protein [Rhodocyclaceae bacterium]|nr:substrate-binding domain-containing protein [Rhodocyclaceae bacterium]
MSSIFAHAMPEGWPTTASTRPFRAARGFLVALLCLLLPPMARADLFAIVGKSSSDANFVAVAQGCNDDATAHGDRCELIDLPGAANFHRQSAAVAEVLRSRRFKGVAISVMSSEAVAKAIQSAGAGTPVITFDSPFDERHAALGRTYVGIDNFAFGREQGLVVRARHPQGGTLCLMTERNDPNLAQRVRGVRSALAGTADLPEGQPLSGQDGWTEHARCPWYTSDSVERALYQTRIALSTLGADAFVSVGHWPILDPAGYAGITEPLRDQLAANHPTVVVGVGQLDPDQQQLLDRGLVHAYVGIDFPRMGGLVYKALRAAADNETLPPMTILPVSVSTRK